MTTIRDIEAKRQSQQSISGADQLRKALDKLEVQVAMVKRLSAEEALLIPGMFDTITAQVDELRIYGTNIQAEEARLRAASALFEKKGAAFISKVSGAAYRSAREQAAPTEAQWWWKMDHLVTQQRQDRLQQTLIGLAVTAAVVLVLIVLYNLFLAPSPEVTERVRREHSADQYLMEGDFEGALTQVELGLTAVPDYPDLLVLRGVIETQLGLLDVEEAFEPAELAIADEERFLLMRAQAYAQINDSELAMDDLNASLELNPNSAEAYYMRGVVYQGTGDLRAAYNDYDMASTKAEENGNVQLQAMARMQLANVSQSMMAQPMPAAGPGGTPTP